LAQGFCKAFASKALAATLLRFQPVDLDQGRRALAVLGWPCHAKGPAMNMFQKLDRHADLVNRMADTVGADLGEALLKGTLSGQGLRAAVLNCCRCEGGGECPDWLEAHAQGAEEAPDYCRNRALLAGLKG
jgi:hypothetical protein